MFFQLTHPPNPVNLPHLKGKVAIVTGGNGGIGFSTAKLLAEKGAQVIITSRTKQNGEEAVRKIKEQVGEKSKVMYLLLDLADFSSVVRFTDHFKSLQLPLHILINNAGIMAGPRATIEKGKIESQFGVNHLGHFLLTLRLLPLLRLSEPSRIVHVSSYANYRGSINFSDLQLEKCYAPFISYCQSKLANVVFSNQLADKLKDTKVTSNALHPGDASTNIVKTINPLGQKWGKVVTDAVLRRPEHAAETVVYVATSPDLEGVTGTFWMENEQFEPNPEAKNQNIKTLLWERSIDLVKPYLN